MDNGFFVEPFNIFLACFYRKSVLQAQDIFFFSPSWHCLEHGGCFCKLQHDSSEDLLQAIACNFVEYEVVGMDFVLDIMSLLNYWQQFVVVLTVQEYRPEIYYTLSFLDVWRQTIYFLTYSFPLSDSFLSCLKSSLLLPDSSLCFLFSALAVYSFPKKGHFLIII